MARIEGSHVFHCIVIFFSQIIYNVLENVCSPQWTLFMKIVGEDYFCLTAFAIDLNVKIFRYWQFDLL
jgi:hypothetical protein